MRGSTSLESLQHSNLGASPVESSSVWVRQVALVARLIETRLVETRLVQNRSVLSSRGVVSWIQPDLTETSLGKATLGDTTLV